MYSVTFSAGVLLTQQILIPSWRSFSLRVCFASSQDDKSSALYFRTTLAQHKGDFFLSLSIFFCFTIVINIFWLRIGG